MATIVKTPSGSWKAVVRKLGWPTAAKTFRTKRDAEDWARRAEDEMVRGVYVRRSKSQRLTFDLALNRYLAEVTPTKKSLSEVDGRDAIRSGLRDLQRAGHLKIVQERDGSGRFGRTVWYVSDASPMALEVSQTPRRGIPRKRKIRKR